MSIQLTGILKDPTGNFLPEDIIRITALDSVGNTVEGSESSIITGSDGSYDFPIEEGKYQIEINYEDEFHLIGTVIVEENTPSPITLNYLVLVGTPVVPPVIIETDPNWTELFNEVKAEGTLRDNHQQIREGDLYTSEVKENWVSPSAQMSDESLESSTGSSSVISQVRTYSDENLNEAATLTQEGVVNGANTYSSREAYKASNGKHEIVKEDSLTIAKGSIEERTHVTDGGMDSKRAIAFEETSLSEEVTADPSSLVQTSKAKTLTTTATQTKSYVGEHTRDNLSVPHSQALQEASLRLAETISNVLHTALVIDTQEVAIDASELALALKKTGLTVYDKEAFQQMSIQAGKSQQLTQVDNYLIQDEDENIILDVDTVNKKVKIQGRLEVSNPENFKGDKGDTYDYIFEYSLDNGVTDPWHSTYEGGELWRRQRKTLDEVPIGVWSEGFRLNAQDGLAGDTYYNQYQYSTDDSSKARGEWHNDYVDGDDWRRWRVIENGLPVVDGNPFYGPYSGWFEERLKGLDGNEGLIPHLQYQYSTDGLEPWHTDFISGDHFRREKVDYYASKVDFDNKENPVEEGTWSTATKLVPVKGEDYFDGEIGTSGPGWYYLHNVPSSWFLGDESLDWATYGKDNGTNSIKHLFKEGFGKDPIDGDVVNVATIDESKADTGLYAQSANAGLGAFEYVDTLLHGNVIIDGTLRGKKIRANDITGDKINSNTTVIAGSGSSTAGMNGDDVSTDYANCRFWAGAALPKDAPWRVDYEGNMEMTKGRIELGYDTLATTGYSTHSDTGSRYFDNLGNLRVQIGKLS